MSYTHLAVALDGVGWHPAAWREDAENARRVVDPTYWIELAQRAEAGRLDFLTIEDGFALQSEGYGRPAARTDRLRGRLDSVLVASRIAPLTRYIGLLPTAVVTHSEPFHLAKAIATLDFISVGRAGVRLGIGITGTESKLFGRRDFEDLDRDQTREAVAAGRFSAAFAELTDYAEVLRRLWDSWEDDAEIRDVQTGRFVDREKLHYIDFRGESFSVKGPLTVPRPPQGQPVIGSLAHSTEVFELGASFGDIVWTTPHSVADISGRIAERARLSTQAPTQIFGDLLVALDNKTERGADRLGRLDELAGEQFTSDAEILAGSVTELADRIESWTAAGLDGIRLRPLSHARDLPVITDELVPELQRRGLRPDGYRGSTLRSILGLDRPVSRYSNTEGAQR
ncbi:alkanesulfonate monooxygenase SsuD/methylene tetrahydromethanopterin reductase-like flavin-dependent oxidoreductase (luciferase family) [Rhodococcus sp. 27YEA15]|uniref:LLM class flavin-dependent oxidoreductase n=1 Tax=Rhodococcus sp. 27YEA15 TaxID=3156259 RepID=UPI003C7C587B